MPKTRTEKDSLGNKEVPDQAYYGIHSVRSIENFPISNLKFPYHFIKAIIIIKSACAHANNELNNLDPKKTYAITNACKAILDGKLNDQFPIDIFQSGSGTSSHMNVNEVIANKANEILEKPKGSKFVHPNDDVNKGQSTNNVIPSTAKLSSLFILKDLIINLKLLETELLKKSEEFKEILKSARTHLQDAVPITLGQEFHSYATMLSKHNERIQNNEKYLLELGIGGNAVGTGINTHENFRNLIIKEINKQTKLELKPANDPIEATNNMTDIANLSATLKTLTIDLNKIANDLRIMSSGPTTGLNEINLPPVEPGSSIMPGKINPTMCEMINMVCFQVQGNDTTITNAAQSGLLDLNTTMPIITYNILQSLEILNNSIIQFTNKCIKGITANKDQCQTYFEKNPTIATALNPYIGYDNVAKLVKESLETKKSIKKLILEKNILTKPELDKILDPKNITKPNLK